MTYRLTDSLPYLLNRLGVRTGELFSRRLAPHGVTVPMYRVMAALFEKRDQTLGALSAMTSIELSTLSRLVGAMKMQGLLSRTRPEGNGRIVVIELTETGRSLVAQLIPLAVHHEQAELGVGDLTDAQIAMLKQQLIAMYDNLDALESELDLLRL